jgi:hypothetical protein
VSYGLIVDARVGEAGPGDLARSGATDLRIAVRVLGPSWVQAERVTIYLNGVVAAEERLDGQAGGLKWRRDVRVPRPRGDAHVVVVAMGRGVTAPYWPMTKPYQPTSVEFVPYSLGVTGAIFVDVDGDGRFSSPFSQAERLIADVTDAATLASRLAGYDRAVVTQAASLLRARDPRGYRAMMTTVMSVATPDVQAGLRAYLAAVER